MCKQTASEQADTTVFDPSRKFVKVTGINGRGFVEFEFSVGGPELYVELMLPQTAFEAFCLAQNALRLDEASEPMTSRRKQ